MSTQLHVRKETSDLLKTNPAQVKLTKGDKVMPAQKTYSSEKEIKEIWKLFKETDRKFDKTKKLMEAGFKKAEKRMKYLDELFTGQWGRLMESLVEGDLVRLLKERNIQVDRTLTRFEGRYKGQGWEFDIIAVNGSEVVVVEVKTTLRVKDIKYFQTKLNQFTVFNPEFKGKKIYGAAAYLKADQSSNTYAERQGLFVIRAAGNSASITNAPNFKPKAF